MRDNLFAWEGAASIGKPWGKGKRQKAKKRKCPLRKSCLPQETETDYKGGSFSLAFCLLPFAFSSIRFDSFGSPS